MNLVFHFSIWKQEKKMTNYERLANKLHQECEESTRQTMRLVNKSLAEKWKKISNMKAEEIDELEKILNNKK